MYLSKLQLNPRDRLVRFDLANCQELHRTLLSAFEAERGSRLETRLLFRLEPGARSPVVIAQSVARPDWERLRRRASGYLLGGDGQGWQIKEVGESYESLQHGTVLRFRLRANPTKRLGKSVADRQPVKVGKRVALLQEEQRLAWLERKAEMAGFRLRTVESADAAVPAVDVRPEDDVLGRRAAGEEAGWKPLTFGSVLFEGELEVTDAVAFRQALEQGIGSGKAYGFGLLSVARA